MQRNLEEYWKLAQISSDFGQDLYFSKGNVASWKALQWYESQGAGEVWESVK